MAIHYADIGQRIRQKRLERGLTQEKLSEMIGIGPSHMSHIEGGTTVPSFEVFVALLNALGCSADELLCLELTTVETRRNNWLTDLVADCDTTETKIIADTVKALKESLRRNRGEE